MAQRPLNKLGQFLLRGTGADEGFRTPFASAQALADSAARSNAVISTTTQQPYTSSAGLIGAVGNVLTTSDPIAADDLGFRSVVAAVRRNYSNRPAYVKAILLQVYGLAGQPIPIELLTKKRRATPPRPDTAQEVSNEDLINRTVAEWWALTCAQICTTEGIANNAKLPERAVSDAIHGNQAPTIRRANTWLSPSNAFRRAALTRLRYSLVDADDQNYAARLKAFMVMAAEMKITLAYKLATLPAVAKQANAGYQAAGRWTNTGNQYDARPPNQNYVKPWFRPENPLRDRWLNAALGKADSGVG